RKEGDAPPPRPDGQGHPGTGCQARRDVCLLRLMAATGGHDLPSGSRLGPYEILGPVGAGGMGVVYRARDGRLDRDVAIKILPAALTDSGDARERLRRE